MGVNRSRQTVEAFETRFEDKYLGFQLHCRGVSALRRVLENCAASGNDLSADGAPAEGINAGEEHRSTVLDARDPAKRAEVYLLRTRGAELAEMVTARECEELVRMHSTP